MILNVSGRCDVVAHFTPWFMNRLKEGFIDVSYPFYKKNINRIYFKDVSLILFCTKNPKPILKYLKEIKIPIIFHVTITPYHQDIEKVGNKKEIINSIIELSKIIGSDNLYIRYDPIFISEKYSVTYHIKAFKKICKLLNGYTKHIIISFIDNYKNVEKNKNVLKIIPFTDDFYKEIGINFSTIAANNNMTIQTCCEKKNLLEYGFKKGECMSFNLAYLMTGETKLKKWKQRNCNCVEMVDIGSYNMCKHFCKYCYANYCEEEVLFNIKQHDINSSLIIGQLKNDDIIKIRK